MTKFWKMHGLGNDFVVIDASTSPVIIHPRDIANLSNRHTGIGFDQLLLIEKSNKADFACRIFNADGSQAAQCGNGLRCVARFVHENQLTQHTSFTIETISGIADIQLISYEKIKVKLSKPNFNPSAIPFLTTEKKALYEIALSDSNTVLQFSALSMGNPHIIIKVTDLEKYPVKKIGAEIAAKSIFPQGVNVGFMEIINPETIRIRTFERGAGETYACGSNACAAVVAGIVNYGLARTVIVKLLLGDLIIEWPNNQDAVQMTGAAEWSYKGETLRKEGRKELINNE